MALTIATSHSGVSGTQRVWQGTITFDSSYPTGGEAISADLLGGLVQVDSFIVGGVTAAGVDAVYLPATGKLKLFDEDNTSGVAAEFGNTGDASGVTVTAIVFGH